MINKYKMKKIRILIVDDHEIIHRGIKELLQTEEEYLIEGYAYNGKEAIEKTKELKPDIVFMDISMPIMNGIEAIRAMAPVLSDTKIIVLTQHDEFELISQALKVGAHGYLLKNSTKESFILAIKQVLSNNRFLDTEASEKIIKATMQNFNSAQSDNSVFLTKREIEIIKLIYEDMTNNELADKLNISHRTVETHRRNLMQKLNIKSTVALIRWAIQNKLVSFK